MKFFGEIKRYVKILTTMQTTVEKLPKNTFKVSVTVPAADVKIVHDKLFEELVRNAEIPGFRKGNAPKELVKEKTNMSEFYGDVINELLKVHYPQALIQNKITPFTSPKVEIKEFDIAKDMDFNIVVATRPSVKVGEFKKKLKENYDKKLGQAKAENVKKLTAGEKIEELHVHLNSNDIIDAIVEVTQIELPDMLVEEERDRFMARLVNQAQTIGLSLDQYLIAQKKTAEQLKTEYAKAAEKNLTAEFALAQLVQDEKIVADDAEIAEMFKASGETEVEKRMQNENEKWYIKSILEKNKLISKIIEEIEGENYHDHTHK